MRTAVTAQAHKAVGQDAALQVGVKFLDDIIRQAFGGGIGREGGQEGCEMVSDDLIEDGATGISGLIDGRYHIRLSDDNDFWVTEATITTYLCTIACHNPSGESKRFRTDGVDMTGHDAWP